MLFRALLLSLTFVVSASAQQSKQIGRLSDGRAFRIDESGMRLIDQVAELEVANDELKRQLVSTEDELKQKNGIIESLRAGIKVAPEDRLKEQDLLGKTASGLPKAATVVTENKACPVQECPSLKQDCPVVKQDCPVTKQDCRSELTSLQTGFEEENNRCKDRIALLEAEKKQLLTQSKTPDSERVQLITRLSKAEQEKSQLLEENQSLKANLNQKQSELTNARSAGQEAESLKVAEEKEQNNKLKQELALLKEQLIDTQKEAVKVQESRSSMAQVPVIAPEQPVVRSAPSMEAKNLLASIQSKIMKRKSFLDSVSKSGKGISLSASNLVTTNGMSLDRLRQLVTVNEVEGLKGLRQIEQILDTDIATASRLSR